MALRRRRLIVRPRLLSNEEWEEAEAKRLAACPEAAAYDETEVLKFLGAVWYLDHVNERDMVDWLKESRIPFPPAFTFDAYRLSRYLLHQWHKAEIRAAFDYQLRFMDSAAIARIRRTRGREDLLRLVQIYTSPLATSMLRLNGLADLVPEMMEVMPPEWLSGHRALLHCGRRLMHTCLTEPPQPRSTQWDRQKLLRRIHHRDLQLQSMRKSLYRLRRERKTLLDRIRRAGAHVPPELGQLAADLQNLRQERSEAEARHARTLADLHAHFDLQVAQARADLDKVARECTEALSLLRPWGSEPQGAAVEPVWRGPLQRRRSNWQ